MCGSAVFGGEYLHLRRDKDVTHRRTRQFDAEQRAEKRWMSGWAVLTQQNLRDLQAVVDRLRAPGNNREPRYLVHLGGQGMIDQRPD